MNFVFRVQKDERLYVTYDWISNGHWMLRRSCAFLGRLKSISDLEPGYYSLGYAQPAEPLVLDILKVIPKNFDGFEAAEVSDTARIWKLEGGGFAVRFVIVKSKNFEAFIAPNYVDLLAKAHHFKIKNEGPVALFNADETLFGLVMPVRK